MTLRSHIHIRTMRSARPRTIFGASLPRTSRPGIACQNDQWLAHVNSLKASPAQVNVSATACRDFRASAKPWWAESRDFRAGQALGSRAQ